MDLHSMVSQPGARHRKMRVGRGMGSGKGKTCGRGHKGQYARQGHKHKPGFEGGQMRLLRRIPKRGFNSFTGSEYVSVNVSALSRFENGMEVTPEVLISAGLTKGGMGRIKILGGGSFGKKLVVKAHAFSSGARARIEAAGGKCEVVAD